MSRLLVSGASYVGRDDEGPHVLTRPFVLLCVAILVTFANQALMTPIIPLYVKSLGGTASMAGLVLFAFAVPSFLSRPIMGRASDRWGGVLVLAVGVGALAIGGLLYFIPYMAAVFAASILRGTAWGATSVGGLGVLAVVAPDHRRGEAAGYYNSVLASASIIFPAIALWLIHGHGGFKAVFALSIIFAVAAAPIILSIGVERKAPEAPQDVQGLAPRTVNRGIILAIVLNLAASVPQPSIVSFLPLYAQHLKLGDVSMFYIIAGLLTIGLRPLVGRRADSIGRGPFIAAGLAIQAIGFLIVFLSSTRPLVLAGAVITEVGPAFVGASSMALAMDFAPVGGRGRALATFSMTYQMGAGLGSMLAGNLADLFGLRSMYIGALVVTFLGALLLGATWKQLPRNERILRPAT